MPDLEVEAAIDAYKAVSGAGDEERDAVMKEFEDAVEALGDANSQDMEKFNELLEAQDDGIKTKFQQSTDEYYRGKPGEDKDILALAGRGGRPGARGAGVNEAEASLTNIFAGADTFEAYQTAQIGSKLRLINEDQYDIISKLKPPKLKPKTFEKILSQESVGFSSAEKKELRNAFKNYSKDSPEFKAADDWVGTYKADTILAKEPTLKNWSGAKRAAKIIGALSVGGGSIYAYSMLQSPDECQESCKNGEPPFNTEADSDWKDKCSPLKAPPTDACQSYCSKDNTDGDCSAPKRRARAVNAATEASGIGGLFGSLFGIPWEGAKELFEYFWDILWPYLGLCCLVCCLLIAILTWIQSNTPNAAKTTSSLIKAASSISQGDNKADVISGILSGGGYKNYSKIYIFIIFFIFIIYYEQKN
jgi:hypothetical protein